MSLKHSLLMAIISVIILGVGLPGAMADFVSPFEINPTVSENDFLFIDDPGLNPDFGPDESFAVDNDLTIQIFTPQHEYKMGQNETLTLSGEAIDDLGVLDDSDLEWYSDMDGYLGTGSEIVVTGLSIGLHRLELRSGGQSATVGVAVFAKSWTIIVYMCGDNNLEGNAIQDINEMEQIGSDNNINIVPTLDRISGYNASNGNWTDTRSFYATKDTNTSIINSQQLKSWGELQMDNPNSLYSVVKYSIQNYPAARYAVIIWDHGSGWSKDSKEAVKGSCSDDTSGYSKELEIWEVRTGLRQALNEVGVSKLELLGYDCCLMGMIEVAYETRNESNYFVGSEETEPGDGFEYQRWLASLAGNPSANGGTLGQYLVTAYYGIGYSTLSAANISQITNLTTAVNGLAQAMINSLPGSKNAIKTARNATKKYYDTSYIDLYHFCANLKSGTAPTAVKTAAGSVQTAISAYVVAKGGSAANSNGVSIWFPSTYNASKMNSYANSTQFGNDAVWFDFLDTYF